MGILILVILRGTNELFLTAAFQVFKHIHHDYTAPLKAFLLDCDIYNLSSRTKRPAWGLSG